jgi:hypothetical protein
MRWKWVHHRGGGVGLRVKTMRLQAMGQLRSKCTAPHLVPFAHGELGAAVPVVGGGLGLLVLVLQLLLARDHRGVGLPLTPGWCQVGYMESRVSSTGVSVVTWDIVAVINRCSNHTSY